MTTRWAAQAVITDFTGANYEDPNTTPATVVSRTAPAAATGNQPLFVPQLVEAGGGSSSWGILLAVRGPDTSTVTVTVWCEYLGENSPTQGWVKIKEGLVLTEGVRQTVFCPPGAMIYIQVTASANSPTHLVVGGPSWGTGP